MGWFCLLSPEFCPKKRKRFYVISPSPVAIGERGYTIMAEDMLRRRGDAADEKTFFVQNRVFDPDHISPFELLLERRWKRESRRKDSSGSGAAWAAGTTGSTG